MSLLQILYPLLRPVDVCFCTCTCTSSSYVLPRQSTTPTLQDMAQVEKPSRQLMKQTPRTMYQRMTPCSQPTMKQKVQPRARQRCLQLEDDSAQSANGEAEGAETSGAENETCSEPYAAVVCEPFCVRAACVAVATVQALPSSACLAMCVYTKH